MRKVTMFMQKTCPYCREALRCMEVLKSGNAAYQTVEVEKIDENESPDVAEKFDYYYVPTFYVGGEKMHEGAADMRAVERVLEAAIKE